jgi:hypothetical protein
MLRICCRLNKFQDMNFKISECVLPMHCQYLTNTLPRGYRYVTHTNNVIFIGIFIEIEVFKISECALPTHYEYITNTLRIHYQIVTDRLLTQIM